MRNRLIHFWSLWHVSVFLLFLSFVAHGMAKAQATGGSISGTATREAGGTMPGVHVSLSDVAKTFSREVITDNDGVFLTRVIHAISLGAVVERMQDNELSFGNVN